MTLDVNTKMLLRAARAVVDAVTANRISAVDPEDPIYGEAKDAEKLLADLELAVFAVEVSNDH